MSLEIAKIFLTSEFDAHVEDDANTFTDVVVQLNSGEMYIASFFTYQNIETVRNQNSKSGEFLSGKYFWAKNLILIDSCKKENIEKIIQHLMDEGDFRSVFNKIS